MTDKKQDLRAEVMVLVDIYARALTDRIAELEAQLDAVGAGGVGEMLPRHAQPAPEVMGPVAAWRYQTPTGWHATTDAAAVMRIRAHHTVEPLYTSPQQIAEPVMPVPWVPGPNEFKDWCSRWFGADADDSYLAKAAFDLPPTAQQFERPAVPPPQQIAEPESEPMLRLCPTCGNKRCPRANDHQNFCTGSNEPGQPGSAYPSSPQKDQS